MRFMVFLLFLFVCTAAARKEYSGVGGWKDEYNGDHGMMSYRYKYGDWTGKDSRLKDSFTLTLKFKDDFSLGRLIPSEITVSAGVLFIDPSDPLAGGVVFYPEDEEDRSDNKVAGWLYCEQKNQNHSICDVNFLWGNEVILGEPDSWFFLRKTFNKNGDLCYLSGEITANHHSDEGFVVWHSKRLCD